MFKEYVNNFINTLEKQNIDLTLFKENYKTLKFVVEDNGLNYPAGYSSRENVIRFKDDNSLSSIYHELLHAASTKKDNDYIYCGLSVENIENKLGLGLGLTEGLTETLKNELFGDAKSYLLERFYVAKLAEIIDPDILIKAYFSADNGIMIDELKKYATIDEIKMFLFNLDTYTIGMQNPETADILEIQKAITNCSDFLVQTYFNKTQNIDSYIKGFQAYIEEPSLNHAVFELEPTGELLKKLSNTR